MDPLRSDLKCIPDLDHVLNYKNAFLINVLFKQFPFHSVLLLIVPIFIRTHSIHSFYFCNNGIVCYCERAIIRVVHCVHLRLSGDEL